MKIDQLQNIFHKIFLLHLLRSSERVINYDSEMMPLERIYILHSCSKLNARNIATCEMRYGDIKGTFLILLCRVDVSAL